VFQHYIGGINEAEQNAIEQINQDLPLKLKP
jgi:hypothetical protein